MTYVIAPWMLTLRRDGKRLTHSVVCHGLVPACGLNWPSRDCCFDFHCVHSK